VEGETAGDPGEGELGEVAGEDEDEDAGSGGGEALGEAAVARVAIKVVDGEACDDGGQEGDQDEHDGGEGVEVEAEGEGAGAEEWLVNGAGECDAGGGEERE
jgi:hypothetical protein